MTAVTLGGIAAVAGVPDAIGDIEPGATVTRGFVFPAVAPLTLMKVRVEYRGLAKNLVTRITP